MKLIELFQAYPFDELMPVIVEMFPGTGKYRKPLEEAYNTLMEMNPVISKKNIRYKILKDPNNDTSYVGAEDANFDSPWEVCLGKEVIKERGVDLSDIEVAANCLVNISFIGKHPKSFEEAYKALLKK